MPGRCQKCNNPIAGDGSCTHCDAQMEHEVQTDRAKRFLSPFSSGAEPPAGKVQATAAVLRSTSGDDNGGGHGGGVNAPAPKYSTDDVMAKLSMMMCAIATKDDLTTLKKEFTRETRFIVDEVVAPIQDAIMDAEKRLDELEGSIIHGASLIDPKIQEQIK